MVSPIFSRGTMLREWKEMTGLALSLITVGSITLLQMLFLIIRRLPNWRTFLGVFPDTGTLKVQRAWRVCVASLEGVVSLHLIFWTGSWTLPLLLGTLNWGCSSSKGGALSASSSISGLRKGISVLVWIQRSEAQPASFLYLVWGLSRKWGNNPYLGGALTENQIVRG